MSRLHTTLASVGEVAMHFGAALPQGPVHFARETTEGADGLVVFESRGGRLLRSMGWGFPRLTREMREHSDDPQRLGLVADLTNPMWEHMVVDPRYRCLIVLTHFANPDGMPGHKTRTWFSVKHAPVMAWAGFCRNLPDYGPVYAGMTMAANAAVMPTNDRMPVLLDPHEYDAWLHGSIRDVIGFQHRAPFAAERMVVEHTENLWRSGKLPTKAQPQLALL